MARDHTLGGVPLIISGTGLCGAFTTFSTFTFDTVLLAEDGRTTAAVAYALGSILAGLAAAAFGLLLGSL